MRIIIYVLIFSCFFSCKKKHIIIDTDDIDKLSKAKYEMPSVYGQTNLFILVKNQEIIKTNADFLNYLYELKFKKSFGSFRDFLDAVLNHKIEITKEDFKNIYYEFFVLSKSIKKEYEQGFGSFYLKYTKDFNQKKILNITKLSKDDFFTIQYYFYLNGYQIQEDNYNGYYYLISRDILLK
ncbi:hypothetical protein [Flavobacterium sp. B183]|uniref:hypothetical protein n=1 Tax=Flavobacterium sp. B183 TaxID=907046 RepID=UPI00201F51D3|nr:hypothetical protein [Flavobacterium sp. B183]URC11850.1 hypothetical protein M4I44_17350 [Flavobacterium sp. B183]